MKNILIIGFLIFNLTLSAQQEIHDGIYGRRTESNIETVMEWTLTLNTNGTFLYNFYRDLGSKNPEENLYGKGTWKAENNVVLFFADKNIDIDETHTLNFDNSKARINRKSPRDKSGKKVKESIRFFSSDTPAIKGLELFKKGK